MTRRTCHLCDQEAVVVHELGHAGPWCLDHATQHTCECGHTAAHCPIMGCGDWIPTSVQSKQLLYLNFQAPFTPVTIWH